MRFLLLKRDAMPPAGHATKKTVPTLLLWAMLTACGGQRAPSERGSVVGWESVARTTDDAEVIIEKVSYRSQGLRIWGQVCRPQDRSDATRRHPVLISNHGGFEGIGDWNGGTCRDLARLGYVVAESSYRGEDGSDGRVEVCLGEVDDVLAMTTLVLGERYADVGRVAMAGGSHGGCVTTRAVQRGAPVKVAINIFGPTDWHRNYIFWRDRNAQGATPNEQVFYSLLIAQLDRSAGGPPERFPEAYAARSPVHFASELRTWPGAYLVQHGIEDVVVPVGQSCELAERVGGFHSFHVDSRRRVTPVAPSGCSAARLQWRSEPLPAAWPHNRYFIAYDDLGHDVVGQMAEALFADLLAFLAARL